MHLALVILAIASPVDSLYVGAPERDVAEGLKKSGAKVEWIAASESQAMRRALIDTGLLEAINRSAATPKKRDGAFDFSAFSRFGFATAREGTYVAVMSQAGLRFLLMVRKVPVDSGKDRDGWSEARLHHIKAALADLAPYDLQASKKDRWGNSFQWKGKKGRDRLAVWLIPESDELRVLLY